VQLDGQDAGVVEDLRTGFGVFFGGAGTASARRGGRRDPARLLEHRVGDATRSPPGAIVFDGRLQRESRTLRVVFLLLG